MTILSGSGADRKEPYYQWDDPPPLPSEKPGTRSERPIGCWKCGSKHELFSHHQVTNKKKGSVEWQKIHQVTRGVRHDVDFPNMPLWE